MIFDIPLRDSKGSFYIFFSSKSLPFVCEYPQDNQTILLNIHLIAWDKFLQIKSVDVFTIVATLLS